MRPPEPDLARVVVHAHHSNTLTTPNALVFLAQLARGPFRIFGSEPYCPHARFEAPVSPEAPDGARVFPGLRGLFLIPLGTFAGCSMFREVDGRNTGVERVGRVFQLRSRLLMLPALFRVRMGHDVCPGLGDPTPNRRDRTNADRDKEVEMRSPGALPLHDPHRVHRAELALEATTEHHEMTLRGLAVGGYWLPVAGVGQGEKHRKPPVGGHRRVVESGQSPDEVRPGPMRPFRDCRALRMAIRSRTRGSVRCLTDTHASGRKVEVVAPRCCFAGLVLRPEIVGCFVELAARY